MSARKSGDVNVDISSKKTIEAMFKKIGNVDHIIVAAGSAVLKKIKEINDGIKFSVNNKMLGQVHLTLIGQNYIQNEGSITLIAEVIKDKQIKICTMYALANGAVADFAKAMAFDIQKNISINCVSRAVFNESLQEYANILKGLVQYWLKKLPRLLLTQSKPKRTNKKF